MSNNTMNVDNLMSLIWTKDLTNLRLAGVLYESLDDIEKKKVCENVLEGAFSCIRTVVNKYEYINISMACFEVFFQEAEQYGKNTHLYHFRTWVVNQEYPYISSFDNPIDVSKDFNRLLDSFIIFFKDENQKTVWETLTIDNFSKMFEV